MGNRSTKKNRIAKKYGGAIALAAAEPKTGFFDKTKDFIKNLSTTVSNTATSATIKATEAITKTVDAASKPLNETPTVRPMDKMNITVSTETMPFKMFGTQVGQKNVYNSTNESSIKNAFISAENFINRLFKTAMNDSSKNPEPNNKLFHDYTKKTEILLPKDTGATAVKGGRKKTRKNSTFPRTKK